MNEYSESNANEHFLETYLKFTGKARLNNVHIIYSTSIENMENLGGTFFPENITDNITIEISKSELIKFSNKEYSEIINIISHELTHVYDRCELMQKLNFTKTCFLNLYTGYPILKCWGEFHASQVGVYIYHKYIGLDKFDKSYFDEYTSWLTSVLKSKNNSQYGKTYDVMAFLGKLKAMKDLFPNFDLNLIVLEELGYTKLFNLLDKNNSLDLIFDNFNEFWDILSEAKLKDWGVLGILSNAENDNN